MEPRPSQFSLRRLFFINAVLAFVVGAYVGYGRAVGNAQRQAIRNAIRDGRIGPEEYRDILGDEVDTLRPAKPVNKP
jgi:hypothetical protein